MLENILLYLLLFSQIFYFPAHPRNVYFETFRPRTGEDEVARFSSRAHPYVVDGPVQLPSCREKSIKQNTEKSSQVFANNKNVYFITNQKFAKVIIAKQIQSLKWLLMD